MSRALAWGLLAVALALAVVGLVLATANGEDLRQPLFELGLALAFTAPGALLAARRPRNPIGWILCAVGGCQAVSLFTYSYAIYSLQTRPGALPGGEVAAWVSTFAWIGSLGPLVTFLLLLFPNGRLPSPRWRGVAWPAGLAQGVAIAVVAAAFWPLRGLPVLDESVDPVSSQLTVVFLFILLCAVASVASLLVRFRRAQGDERQQLKWFGFAAALTLVSVVSAFFDLDGWEGLLLFVGAFTLPVAVAVAVLRYRLYDLDRLINRTVVYSVVTVLLAAAYLAAVTVLQRALDPLTGESQLAVAASTLAVAALFRPLRSRVQAGVDRRFNRRRYDAARTVEQFRGSLRDAVDLDALSSGLLSSVRQTVQPSAASLWLRRAP